MSFCNLAERRKAKMYECIVKNRHFHDLNPILFGEEECAPDHSFGPMARDYTLIHFVTKGHGFYLVDGVKHPVGPGEAFIIRPHVITTYSADPKDPWSYCWVGFDGELSEHFWELPPVVKYTTNWAEKIIRLPKDWSKLEYQIAAKLFLMYSEWFAEKKEKNDYVRSIKDYVSAKYIESVSVEEIAAQLNLDRRYISRYFKQKTGKSVQEYIIWVRIEKAKKLLGQGSSVSEAARLCGYDDVCNFSKMFKKRTGISPGRWKKSQTSASEEK